MAAARWLVLGGVDAALRFLSFLVVSWAREVQD
jgi:hypothetical protein